MVSVSASSSGTVCGVGALAGGMAGWVGEQVGDDLSPDVDPTKGTQLHQEVPALQRTEGLGITSQPQGIAPQPIASEMRIGFAHQRQWPAVLEME